MNWKRIGQEELGAWPEVYRHEKKGFYKLRIRHNTPKNYQSAKRWAIIQAILLAGAWIPVCPVFLAGGLLGIAAGGGVALISLMIPNALAERRMKKHPMTGRTTDEYLIKNGQLLMPGRQKIPLEQFHSANAGIHQLAPEEERAEVLARFEKGRHPKKVISDVPHLYRKTSQMRVRAGHRGAQMVGVIDFYNDEHSQFSGLAAASVDYVVGLARAESDDKRALLDALKTHGHSTPQRAEL